MNIFVDSNLSDETRRTELYRGAIFVNSPSENTLKLCRLAQEMIEEAFPGLDPLRVHKSLPAERSAAILSELKPKFIHHPESKKCIQAILAEAG